MTTFYTPQYRLPRATAVAATLQLAGLLAASCLSTLWAGMAVAYIASPGDSHSGVSASNVAIGVVAALAIGVPVPAVTVKLVVAMRQVRRIGPRALLQFELISSAVLAGVLAAGMIVCAAKNHSHAYLGFVADVGLPFAAYGILAAAVAAPIVAQTRRQLR